MLQTDTHKPSPTNQTSHADRTQRIRELNDMFRRHRNGKAHALGHFAKSAGISALGWAAQFEVIERVKLFEEFTEANDPHGEHDFGAFWYKGQHIFWKIDYYTPDFKHGSADPSDPAQTQRVLTVMLAEEY